MKCEGIWRKVVDIKSEREEHFGRSSWWLVMVHTIELECGHKKVYRNRDSTNKQKRALCKECK